MLVRMLIIASHGCIRSKWLAISICTTCPVRYVGRWSGSTARRGNDHWPEKVGGSRKDEMPGVIRKDGFSVERRCISG